MIGQPVDDERASKIGHAVLFHATLVERYIDFILEEFFCRNLRTGMYFQTSILKEVDFHNKIKILKKLGFINGKYKKEALFPIKETRNQYAHSPLWLGLIDVTYKGDPITNKPVLQEFLRDCIAVRKKLQEIRLQQLPKKIEEIEKESKWIEKNFEREKKTVLKFLKKMPKKK